MHSIGLQDFSCPSGADSEQLDPTAKWIRELHLFCPGALEFHEVFLSASLFDNMHSANDVYNYVHKQLQSFA